MISKKVSIVIPVYNVEKYIEQCLTSIVNQSYQNLEIIIVDDESPDSSGKIADSFAEKDERIIVKHITNRGAAGARNVALDLVTGAYVMFVDSDDWLELDAVSVLVRKMEESAADIVMCQYVDEYANGSYVHSIAEHDHCYNKDEAVREYIDHWEYPLIWNKMFRSELLKDVRFVEGHCIDDEFFTYHLFSKAEKTLMITESLYHYRQRKSGAMSNPDKQRQRCRDQVEFVTVRYEDLKLLFPQLENRLLEHMCEVYMMVMRGAGSDSDEFRYAKSQLWKYGRKALRKPIDINMKKSIFCYLMGRKEKQYIRVSQEDRKELFE